MNVICTINLSDEEVSQLAGILRCEEDDLEGELGEYANAALEEYARMFLGQKVFTRGSDFREYRLFLLIRHAFGNELPNEQDVCDRFQLTVSQARSLIRSVMSKYQYELDAAIENSLRRELQKAVGSEDDDEYLITVDNEGIVHALNRTLASIDGTLPPIGKKTNTVSTFRLKPSSREALFNYFELEIEGPEDE